MFKKTAEFREEVWQVGPRLPNVALAAVRSKAVVLLLFHCLLLTIVFSLCFVIQYLVYCLHKF